jgi:hypothetical protein
MSTSFSTSVRTLVGTSVRQKQFVNPSGTGHNICYGDKIFVRLTVGSRTLLELTVTRVNDLSELYGVIRSHVRSFRGLTAMYIRNISRGWSATRPLMLYPSAAPRQQVAVQGSLFSVDPQPERRMLMPWETH